MKAIFVGLIIVMLLLGCVTEQRDKLSEMEEPEQVLVQASGLGGFILGAGVAIISYNIYQGVR